MLHIPSSNRLFSRIQPSENFTLLFLSLAVGLLTAISILGFRAGITWFHWLFVEELGNTVLGNFFASLGLSRALTSIPVLMLAGWIVGWIMDRFVGHEKYHGVAGIMEAVALSGGRLPYWRIPFKALSAMISNGAGASVGTEDPSVQIGSNVGSWLGQKLHLSEERVNLLVGAGAASAIASAFNAPIAGVFFAMELILGEFSTKAFGIVVLSAVISSSFTRAIQGENPIFANLPPFVLGNPFQLIFYAILGIGIAIFAALGLRYYFWQSDLIHRVKLSRPIKTMLAGAIVGSAGVLFPQIMGAGESFMHGILQGHTHLAIDLLLMLAVVKIVMSVVSQSGGFVGGIFAPSLFMGIVLGNAYGLIINQFFPVSIIGAPTSYAIAGMAAMLAGFVRVPITAVMLVFEITTDYHLILPILITTVVCTVVIERYGPAGIYTLNLLRHGIQLPQGRDIDVMQTITAREVMKTPAPTIPGNATLSELRDAFRHYHTRALCVLDDRDQLTGIVTLGDLQAIFEKALVNPSLKPDTYRVGDICTHEVITAFPDDALWIIIRKMGAHDIGRVPIITPHRHELMGVVRRQDIMNAYNVAIARKLQAQQKADQIRLNTLTGAHILEFYIDRQCKFHDKPIADIPMPPEALIASIQRKGKLIVPHGSTLIQHGDVLTIVADEHADMVLNDLFKVGYSTVDESHQS